MEVCAEKRQDLPPPGGYGPINYKRVPPKTYMKGWGLIGGYFAVSAVAAYLYYLGDKAITREKIERRSAHLALYPMLLAERDREFLKQIRRNRDEEAKLMANVPGWVVGTYYGEPIYHLQPKDAFISPTLEEFFVHGRPYNQTKRQHLVNSG